MKIIYFYLLCIVIMPTVVMAHNSLRASSMPEVNLTDWREHRRKKRFILFEGSGICKLVTGITYPVDLGDKKPWRQLVLTMNIHYQFPVPSKPSDLWDKWQRRNLAQSFPNFIDSTPSNQQQPDEAQQFLYEFSENLMNRRATNGRECLLKAICENAQIHEHQGLYAELLHRFLTPHRNLESYYLDAWHMGKTGVDCLKTFPKANKCLLDKYTHVREEFMEQSSLI